MTISPIFPNGLDVFVPLLDGYHPITADDLNERQRTIEKIQQALGWGTIDGAVGPKGPSSTVAARLGSMFEADGGMKDIAFVTGTVAIGRFSEDLLTDPSPKLRGLYIPFGKTITGGTMGSSGYAVLFSSMVKDGGSERNYPGIWYVANRDAAGVTIGAKKPTGPNRGKIEKGEETQIIYSLLAIGPGAAVMV